MVDIWPLPCNMLLTSVGSRTRLFRVDIYAVRIKRGKHVQDAWFISSSHHRGVPYTQVGEFVLGQCQCCKEGCCRGCPCQKRNEPLTSTKLRAGRCFRLYVYASFVYTPLYMRQRDVIAMMIMSSPAQHSNTVHKAAYSSFSSGAVARQNLSRGCMP